MIKPHTTDPSFMLENHYRVVGLKNGCKLCGSPVHPATGNEVDMHCGPCCLSLVVTLKQMTAKRKCGGVMFYDHAFPPPLTRP